MQSKDEIGLIKSVIVLVADEKYLPHAKSTMVNCRRQGQWKEDFCLILPPSIDAKYFTDRGIAVFHDNAPSYYRKFAIFDEYFNQQYMTQWQTPEYRWDAVLYMDEDVLVQNPLAPLIHEAGWCTVSADREPFTQGHAFTHWTTPEKMQEPKAKELFDWMWANYDPDGPQYTTCVLAYRPRTLPAGIRQTMTDLWQKLAPINTHVVKGTDQPIINLALAGKFERFRSDLACYWRSAWDDTVIVHYCSGYAPWIEKTPKMNAYFNFKLGRPCHDIYQENLAAFEQEFPIL